MRLPRIFVQESLTAGTLLKLERGPAHHLTKVLRLEAGDLISLFNGDGREYSARLTTLGRGSATAETLVQSEMEPVPSLPIHLAIGISKGDRMDTVVQKSVELGVTCITPLITDRCVVRLPPERRTKRLEHWRGVIIAACGQSGRNRIPELEHALPFEEWLERPRSRMGLLLDHRSVNTLNRLEAPEKGVDLLVGPEGGLSDTERQLAENTGYTGTRLGPRVLRTETAPLAAIAAIQMLWGDFR
ncbi:MAG: 16S rRNA (uracil(1498)-N(3))-methyltransferase [Gammaproteobacteria bacterium]|nr:16S rRNA (uracil(1498)-N(3))-methyltransferase [Gammaproteobacteria bacterium]